MSENAQNDATRRQHTAGIEQRQAELAKRYAATRRPEQEDSCQESKAAAARRAADTARRDSGRSL